MQLPIPWDPIVEGAFIDFSETAFAAQAKTETLHPIYKQLYVSALREQLTGFYTDVQEGYETLLNTVLDLNAAGKTLAGIEPTHTRSIKAIKHLFPSKEALEKITQVEEGGLSFNEKVPLFVALDMSPKALEVMYEAACFLLDQDKDSEARMCFRTLLALAPHIADFWTAYAVSLIRLKRLEEAIESLERALFLDSRAIQALLLLCRALVELGRTGEAHARLGEKLDDAARRGDKELYNMLEEARFGLVQFASGIK
jgi:tetratricopeptide (TPR) repeat protein